MEIHKVMFVMVTMIDIVRETVIRKAVMENYCNKNSPSKTSVNDDLESFFEDLRVGKQPKDLAYTYYFPKLTEKESQLLEIKDQESSELLIFSETFAYGLSIGLTWNPSWDFDSLTYVYDINNVAEMMPKSKISKSKSKHVAAFCCRETFTIDNSYPKMSGNSFFRCIRI